MNNNNQSSRKEGGGDKNTSHPLDRYTVQPSSGDKKDESPFYKPSAPVISVPQGGGALKGIDEKFSVNAVNGTANLTIPFPSTPGRSGFTPALSLFYNSGSGNSEFGLGWGLSLSAIQRKTDKKLPRYHDESESDVFLLADAEDLVPLLDASGNKVIQVSGNYTIKYYRPRIEGLFARIEYIKRTGSKAGWWRVTTKDNLTTYYGLTAEARITDPAEEERIFKWLPELALDHKGNVHWYSYAIETLDNVDHQVHEKNRINQTAACTNTYLKRVRYCNEVPFYIDAADVCEPEFPGAVNFLMETVLDYGDHSTPFLSHPDITWPSRHDPFSSFQSGFEIRTYRKCRRVLQFHYFSELNGGDEYLVRSLELSYRNDNLSPGTLAEVDYITAAVQKGYDGSHSSALPAMTFDYEPLQWDNTIHSVSPQDFSGAPQGLTGPYQWVDFEGEGISGILVEQGTSWHYKNNLGEGYFTAPKTIASKPSFTGLQWQDLDADGNRQAVARDQVKGFWELADDQEWQPFQPFDKKINIDWNSPFTRMLDLDGDGRADVLITEDRAWTWYRNLGKEGYEKGGNAAIVTDEEKGPVLLLRDDVQCIFLADMSGDGMTDLVRIKNGEVCYWPNMGYGKFGIKVTMSNAPLFHTSDLFNPLYLTLADISGTGAADLIYIGQHKCLAWTNYCGNGWSEATEINPLPSTDTYSKVAVLDFKGNGTGCLVWSSPLPAHANAPLRYIDLMGGQKPHLMRRYSNGMGKLVEVFYKSSTTFYLADKLSGKPWATRLPFPVHCISKITTTDTVSGSNYTQTYKYRHGYYDHEEREFRGFGYVETLDTDSTPVSDDETLDQAPVLTKTWYHTGAWLREQTLTDQFKKEYFVFEGWDDMTSIAELPSGLTAAEWREAHRALKGSPLRQEVYALDGTAKERIPYTITANAYKVQLVQPRKENRFGSFLNYQQQSVAFNCERDPSDPRILHELTLETDEYGNVLQKAQIAYPRRHSDTTLPLKVQEEQAKMHITCTQSIFTNDAIDSNHYRLRLPYEVKNFEALGIAPAGILWRVEELLTMFGTATPIDFSATPSGAPEKRLLSHTRTLYKDNTAGNSPQALGSLQSLAIPHEQYQLVFTEPLLNYCFDTRVDNSMLSEGGYVDLDGNKNYWLPSGTVQYRNASFTDPAQQFFSPLIFTDPWGNKTEVTYWGNYWQLPERVTNALGYSSIAEHYDWRVLQPLRTKDANDNYCEVLYDALGMLVALAFKGKDDPANPEGDSLDGLDPYDAADMANQHDFFQDDPDAYAHDLLRDATWRCVYDLNSTPIAVGMIARQHHTHNPLIVQDQSEERIVRLSYTDGLGRIIMHKVQCEAVLENDYKQWIGSGRTVYNNKGKTVMQFEPYFSDSHFCDETEQAANLGVSSQLYYDPLNRPYRTNVPDGTFSKTEWTAWRQEIWDRNDTVLASNWYAEIQALPLPGATPDETAGIQARKEAADKASKHDKTPTVMHLDTLARPFYNVQEDKPGNYIHSYANLDLPGNRLSVVDGLRITGTPSSDPLTLQYRHNMLKQICFQNSIDCGNGFTLTDVAGHPLYAWDTDNRKFRIEYDLLRRVIRKWMKDTHLLEITNYGEGISGGAGLNLIGQVYEHFDSSGRQWMPDGYDFKGNPIAIYQQLPDDKTLTDADWNNSSPALSAEIFITTSQTDALERPVQSTDPGNNITELVYERSGALKIVRLNSNTYVQDIHYNAKGQRHAIWYGNGTKTGYTYDPETYRLQRLLTVNADTGSPHYNEQLQDLNYYYDPVGNITRIRDKAQQTIYFDNTIVSSDQAFIYDALYRLIESRGREQKGTAFFGSTDNHTDQDWMTMHKGDGNKTQVYAQTYSYDAVGNIQQLQHLAGSGSYTRNFKYNNTDNRLVNSDVSGNTYGYKHDARGNMEQMPHLDKMEWNAGNSLYHLFRNSSVEAWYQYSGGQRIRKYVLKSGMTEERIYLSNYEIYRRYDNSGSLILERTTVHISDDAGRIAMLETRTQGSDSSPYELERYIYANHLGSAALELNKDAEVISYEEYHPYGTTAYQAMSPAINAVAKRYRYTGKERDEESGLYYHGARYYIPWLCRWSAADPINNEWYNQQKGNPERNRNRDIFDLTPSPYEYCYANPLSFSDPTGEQGNPVQQALREGEEIYNRIKNNIEETIDDTKDNIKEKVEEIVQAHTQTAGKAVIYAIKEKTRIENAKQNTVFTIKGASVATGKSDIRTDTDTLSAVQYDLYVHTDTQFNIDESNAKEFGNYELGVVSMLLNQFVSGKGPENYSFPENGIISNKFIENKSAILKAALTKFLKNPTMNVGEQFSFGFGDLVSDRKETGTLSSITGYVGSAYISIENNAARGGVVIQIFNVTSLTSGSLGKEVDLTKTTWPKSIMRDPNEVTPYGNISQTFNLFIPYDNNNKDKYINVRNILNKMSIKTQ